MCVVVLVVALMFDVDVEEVEEALLRATSYENNMGDGNGLNLLGRALVGSGLAFLTLGSWTVVPRRVSSSLACWVVDGSCSMFT